MAAEPTPAELLEFATECAAIGSRTTLEYFQRSFDVELKADRSVVTIADRTAEERMREAIASRYPGHRVLGEEFGETGSPDSPYRWILDPIDGTASFVRGVPLYGVLVGVEFRGEAVVGAVAIPPLGETVAAARGEGCFWNGARARVSAVDRLDEALLLATDTSSMARYGRGDAYERLRVATKMQRTWGDCYGHLLVATGRAEIMVDPIMSIWDCAALLPILVEAGGTFTDWSGTPTHTGGEAMSTNGHLLDRVLATVAAA